MKRMSLLFIILTMSITPILCDFTITLGPAVGEIYFWGPTVTGDGLYRSTDFGETATCVDSTLDTDIYISNIAADITPGLIYGYSMPENLWISYDYGSVGSWIFRDNDVSNYLLSGVTEGWVYIGYWVHSEDYGLNFVQHSYNGIFGDPTSFAIDVEQNIGYVASRSDDSIYIFISYDNFENVEVQHVFNLNSGTPYQLTRGAVSGELYLIKSIRYGEVSFVNELWYSNDYGESWEFKNYIRGIIEGGRQPGEIYTKASYELFLGEIKHTYIYHSLDFGETFTEYHPFSHGPEAYWADFEADVVTGTAPLAVNFSDMSSGDEIYAWEWDFNNDGIVDSCEQNPEYTYQDTGYYSIELMIYFYGEYRGYVKRNYIHVTDGNDVGECKIENVKCKIQNYPNPFNPSTVISYKLPDDIKSTNIELYNLRGQKIDTVPIDSKQSEIVWNANMFPSGIYLYKLEIKDSPIKKMILLK